MQTHVTAWRKLFVLAAVSTTLAALSAIQLAAEQAGVPAPTAVVRRRERLLAASAAALRGERRPPDRAQGTGASI